MDNTLPQELKKIGLSDKEALVYSTVLELGTGFPSKIAERTKLNRSTVYKILTDLAIKGLVTELEKNKKLCYQAEPPSKLVGYAKTKIRLAEDGLEHAKKMLPELEGLFSVLPQKPKVRFFDGIDGVKAVYSDHIAEAKPYEMLDFSNVEELMKLLPPQFVQHYVKQKEKIGVITRGIFPETKFSEKYNCTVYRGIQKKFLVTTRYIPAEKFPYKGEVAVYGQNKVSIINFHENALIAIIIEDKMIADMMRMIFELAWVGAK